jgi:Mrp family chromosome partitioning ATPase
LSSLGHKVAVVDADFLKPSLSKMVGPGRPGLTDLLTGRAALDEVASAGGAEMTIIPAGDPALFSPDMLHADRMRALVAQLRQRYAYVLIDSCPVLAHSEAGAIAEHMDGIVVVSEWMKTSRKNMDNMFAALGHVQTPVLGVVINKVDPAKYKTVTPGSDFLLPRPAKAA